MADSNKEPRKHTPGKASSTGRLGFLDWTRGLAAVIMLQGHVFHSFTSKDLRDGSAYVLSQFVGGMPPAIFLFLTGITLAFLMDSNERKGLAPLTRWTTALRRAGYLFTLAYLFRLQLWAFGLPKSPWTDLLKVDILNCMGFAIVVMSVMSVFSTRDRVRHCAVLGIGIAAASPVVSGLNWGGAPPLLRMYLVPDYNYFSFFPWAAFLAFGMSAGSILRSVRPEQLERLMQWGALGGFGLIVGGRYFSDIPYSFYANSQFWLDSPALTFIKTGVLLLMLAFAWLWHSYVIKNSWSWVCQLGATSLLVYWVHTEIVYGRWFWMWKENLSVPETVVVAVIVIASMVALSTVKTRWNEVRAVLPSVRRLEPRAD